MSGYVLKSRTLSLASIWLVLAGLCSGGVSAIWFGRPGEGWTRNRAIWVKPQVEVGLEDRAQYPDTVVDRDYWPTEDEEDDKRNGQLSSQVLFNLIRGKGRSSTTKRSAECESNEFRCSEGSCIPKELKCNGVPDCPQGTDEQECQFPARREMPPPSDRRVAHYPIAGHAAAQQELKRFHDCVQKLIYGLRIAGPFTRSKQCEVGYSRCALQTQCYDSRYACDGYIDCVDASDEMECASTPCPAAGYTKCANGWQCFDATHTCDGLVDCVDGSDERNCGNRECLGLDQIKCGDGKQCYRADFRCDGIIDCTDGTDENNCSMYQCGSGFRKCANGLQCFNTSLQCDGIAQCVDGSDEANCPAQGNNSASPNTSFSGAPEWSCQHHSCADGSKCYLNNLRCDGIPACDDGSDEWDCGKRD
ncbi:sortilin-related receptor-like [Patiria miniata]|uniref:Uncharacterized protein n=1 Tax=Patiria miniata TaxID=46514 RepID=A0A913ZBM9_PATMI|nr:sortilin-related receptor-like [Patiria miniata]